jgi:iron-sulfur cluster assembly protein
VLVLTHDAATIIRAIVDQSETPGDAGLRIAAKEVDGDEEQEGAHIFLEPIAAEALSDKVLDASVEDGGVRFTLTPQPGGPLQSSNGYGAEQ